MVISNYMVVFLLFFILPPSAVRPKPSSRRRETTAAAAASPLGGFSQRGQSSLTYYFACGYERLGMAQEIQITIGQANLLSMKIRFRFQHNN
jgi:hypothetical protein